MSWFEIIIIGACVVLVLLPPKYDPAIRLKEWLSK
jgi:Sec-independent protein translocase protein TatA